MESNSKPWRLLAYCKFVQILLRSMLLSLSTEQQKQFFDATECPRKGWLLSSSRLLWLGES